MSTKPEMSSALAFWRLCPDYVNALSEARIQKKSAHEHGAPARVLTGYSEVTATRVRTSGLPTILPRSLAETCSILSIPGTNRIQELLRVVANPVLEDDFDVLNVRNSL